MQTIRVLFIVVTITLHYGAWKAAHASRSYVCTPQNSTLMTDCSKEHWIRIASEIYAPRRADSSGCDANLTLCNNFVQDTGLLTNCNGPVKDESSPCREEVDFQGVQTTVQCLDDAPDLAAIVDYSCVPRTSVLDLCSTATFSQTSSTVYLASPHFPESPPLGQMCVCSVQGSRMKLEVIDLKVKANMRWDDPSLTGDPEAVLTVHSGDELLWSSNAECPGCQHIRLLNTRLYFPTASTLSNVTLTYSDFGLVGQNAWVKIFNLGSSINITCASSPLSSDRIITTTTTTTTTTTMPTTTTMSTSTSTTPTTTSSTSTTSTTPSTTTTLTSSTTTTVKTTQKTTVKSDPTPNGGDTGVTQKPPPNQGTPMGSQDGDEEDDETVVIVVLIFVLLLLMAFAGVLFFFIYKRRGKLGSVDLRSTCTSCVEMICQKRQSPAATDTDDANEYQLQTYDNVAVSPDAADEDVYQGIYNMPTDTTTNQTHSSTLPAREKLNGDSATKSVENGASSSSTAEKEDYLYSVPMKKVRIRQEPTYEDKVKRNTDSDSRSSNSSIPPNQNGGKSITEGDKDPGPLFDPRMYVSHQQLVGQEVARIKMERSLNSKAKAGQKPNGNGSENENGQSSDKRNTQAREKSKSSTSNHGKSREEKDYKPKSQNSNSNNNKNTQSSTNVSSSNSSLSTGEDDNNKKDEGVSAMTNSGDQKVHYLKRAASKRRYNKKREEEREAIDSMNSEKQLAAEDLRLSPEEGQMFEALGIAQARDSQDSVDGKEGSSTGTGSQRQEKGEKLNEQYRSIVEEKGNPEETSSVIDGEKYTEV